MRYKVWSKDGLTHKWNYDFFRESVDGTIYSFDGEGSRIKYIILIVKKPIPQAMFDHFFFDYEILSEE